MDPSLSEIVKHNQLQFSMIAAVGLLVLTAISVLLYKAKVISDEEVLGGDQPSPSPQPSATPTTMTQPVPEAGENMGPIIVKAKNNWLKIMIFVLMTVVVLGNTFYLIGSTLYVNMKSVSGGPVHWHADFEFYRCGEKIDLIDPKPPSNKVGTPLLHEHNDGRIHVEEAIFDMNDVTLGSFMRVVGGEVSESKFVIPTQNMGSLALENGDSCPDDKPGMVQVFVYQTDKDKNISQKKLEKPQGYILSGYQNVPPGDCIIVEFDSTIKEATDKMCTSYAAEMEKRNRGK